MKHNKKLNYFFDIMSISLNELWMRNDDAKIKLSCLSMHKCADNSSEINIQQKYDLISDMYLTLEIEKSCSYENEIDVYKIIDNLIIEYSIDGGLSSYSEISNIGLYMDYCIDKHAKFILSNNKIIYTLPINPIFWLKIKDRTQSINIKINIDNTYKNLVKNKYITTNDVLVDKNFEKFFTSSRIYNPIEVIKYYEYKYVVNSNNTELKKFEINGKIDIPIICGTNKFIRDIVIFVNNKDLKILNLDLTISGTQRNNCDIEFYSQILPKKLYNTIFPNNMFIIPFDDNQSNIPKSYINTNKMFNGFNIIIEFDITNKFNINGLEIIFLYTIFPRYYKDIISNNQFNHLASQTILSQYLSK